MSITNDPQFPLRLALSHREKAEAAIRHCDRSLATGGVDRDHHANLRASYEREQKRATRTIDRLLLIEQARLEALEAQRRTVLEEQLHLPERVAAGRLTPQGANDANRKLAEKLRDLDDQIVRVRARAESKTAEQLGGFIDLPFGEYAQIEANQPAASGTVAAPAARSRDGYGALLLATFAAAAVFLPWIGRDGVSASLASSGSGLAQVAADAGVAPGVARNVWLLYALFPFATLIVFGIRNVIAAAWVLLLVGLIMLAAAAFPILLVGASGGSADSLLSLAGALRAGAAVYCLCALCLIVLGAFRISPPGDNLRHAVTVSFALFIAFVAVGLLAALALLGVRSVPHVRFDATQAADTGDRISFSVANDGRAPVSFYLPMPDSASSTGGNAFGIRLDVKEQGQEEFRTAPPTPFVWGVNHEQVNDNRIIEIAPDTSVDGYLDLRQLSAAGFEPGAVRLVMQALDGRAVESRDFELSGKYLSTTAPVREPATPEPTVARPAPVRAVESAPSIAAAPAAATAVPLRVEFAGTIGDKAVIQVYSGNEPGQEVVAAVGETVIKDWQLEAIVKRPSSLMLRHAVSGNTAQVIRGNVVDIGPVATAPADE